MLAQIYDYINSELTHNKTYAHRLPPTFLEQARHWANYHEHGVFSEKDIHGIGNSTHSWSLHLELFDANSLLVAGRTLLHTIITSLERIAFNGDPLQFMLVETTYQPFISLFQQTGVLDEHPELAGFRE